MEKQYKVCHITSVHPRYDSRILYKECCSLSKAGYEVVLLCADNQENEIIDEVLITSIVAQKKSRIIRVLTSSSILFNKALEINAQIYHFHDPELLPLAVKLRKRGKVVIYDSHEDVPRQIMCKYWIPKFIRRPISYVFERYENRVVKKLNAVVTSTDHIKNRFNKINMNTYSIHNYPILEEVSSDTEIARERAMCFVGSLSESNGIIQLLEVAEITGVKLYLAGKIFGDIKTQIEQKKDHENIIYLGIINRKQVYDLYSRCSIGIVADLPTGNNIEGLPIKMFEFMNAGLPFITSDFPLRRSIIKTYSCGILVDPMNIKQTCNEVMDLLVNKDKLDEMGKRGKTAVLNEFNWNIEQQILIKLYDSLLTIESM